MRKIKIKLGTESCHECGITSFDVSVNDVLFEALQVLASDSVIVAGPSLPIMEIVELPDEIS